MTSPYFEFISCLPLPSPVFESDKRVFLLGGRAALPPPLK